MSYNQGIEVDAMTTRTRKTPEQMIAGLERKLQAVKSKAKNMERAKQTRRAIILGQTIQAMADAGDADAKRAMDKVLAGLRRKQDRDAFDLEPLPDPGPDNRPAKNPPGSGLLAAAEARRALAVEAWKVGNKTPDASRLQADLAYAIADCEKLTGECWTAISSQDRASFGLSDRPGELAGTS